MNLPENLISKLSSADNILFFTGAGISAESGIHTFRGEEGIWNKMKPEELASMNGFMKNPNLEMTGYISIMFRRQIKMYGAGFGLNLEI